MSRRDEVMRSFYQYEDETEHRVKNGIELYRKGYAHIHVTDAEGNPVSGVKIHAKLSNHAFLHGANVFMLDEMETEEKNENYKRCFPKCFNEATVPIYWDAFEPERGKPRFAKDSQKVYRRPPLDLCLEFCEKNGITPKAHCLNYSKFSPEWIDQNDVMGYKRELDRRFRALSENYAERIPMWEVVNELDCSNLKIDAAIPYFRGENILGESFDLAEKYFNYNHLVINEATQVFEPHKHFAFDRSAYYLLCEKGLRDGHRIDSIGIQCHNFRKEEAEKDAADSIYNPMQMYTVLDQYAKLGKPLQITEITIPCYHDTAEDYDLQSEILERLYKIWFSHPAVEAAIYWNLTDGYAAFAPLGDMTAGENYYRGGLMEFSGKTKPAFDMLCHLFHEEWMTDTTAETDGEGNAKFCGFYGDYELEIDGKRYPMKHFAGDRMGKKIVLPIKAEG